MKSRLFLMILAGIGLVCATIGQTPEQLKRASELFKKATADYTAGRNDAAISGYSEYLKIRPNVATGWYNRGLAYRQKAEAAMSRADFEKAIADFSQAIKLDPKDADFWLYRGHVRLRLIPVDFAKQVPAAIADYTEVIKLRPTSAAGYTGRAQAYEESNRSVEAMADLNKALQLDPNDYVALYTRGKLYTFEKNYASARADLEKAIQLNPNYSAAKSQLSYVNSQSSQAPAAVTAKPQIPTKTPSAAASFVTTVADPSVGFKLADDAEKAGDYRKVIDTVNKALPLIAMKSENVPAKDLESFVYLDLLRKRAKAYLMLKRYTDAIDAHKKSMLAAMDNMNYFNERANQEMDRDKGGSGAGAIMAGVQTTTSRIICRSSFDAANEFVNTIERERPNDLSMQLSTGILMGSIREMCAISSHMDGSFKHSRIYSYMGASLKAEQLNAAIERYTEAINYSQIFRPAYVARAKAYRELGRIDLALADEKKASELPVK